MEEKDFLKTLSALTVDYGITLSTEQARMCHTHITLMLAWNLCCNLTRITDPNEIIEKHLLDSLDIVVLVADIEEAFNIVIDVTDIMPENFNSLEAILNLIERRGGQI